MRALSAGLAAALALSAIGASSGDAQQLRHRGFWAGAGLATALSDVSCNVCINDSKSVVSGYLRGGLTLNPKMLLGLELVGTDNSEDGVNERVLNLTAVLYYYPSGRGFFLKGGLGVLKYRADNDTDEFTSTLLAGHLGAGYELRVSQRVSLAAFSTLIATANGDLDYNGSRVTDDLNLTLVQFGLGVTMH